METKFQTSFIPKKPIVSSGSGMTPPVSHGTGGVSIFMTLGVLFFIVSLAVAGGAYVWKQHLMSAQDTYRTQLAQREQQFNIDLISQLKQINIKVDAASQILRNHVAASQIFDIIGKLTTESVRFLSLDMTVPPAGSSDGVKISLSGYGRNLSAVAFQSDLLGQLEQYGLRTIVKNPILSDPSLDLNGAVSFGFSATIDPSSLSYEQSVNPATSTSNSSSTGTQSITP
jgi:hypothetical protein